MSFPKHFNPRKERAAKAPYNFVSLPEGVVSAPVAPARDSYHAERFTGVIHCMLKTETPLYTRAALEQAELGRRQTKDKADFFYIDPKSKQPVIPGSSLRGMLRTLVEIITFSKPQPVTDRQLFFRTLDDTAIGKAYGKRMVGGDRGGQGSFPNVKAGYMERIEHGYRIRPAQTLHGTEFFRVEEDVAVKVIPQLRGMTSYDDRSKRWRQERSYAWKRCPIWFRPVSPIFHSESAQFYANVTDIRVGQNSPGVGWVQGWFIGSGWVPSKGRGKHRHWIVAPPVTNEQQFVEIKEIDIDAYEELGAGRSQTIEKQKMSVLPKQPGELIPCFYTDWKDSAGAARIAFGHTAMFRLPYEYSPRDLLPYRPEEWEITDFAETIFGWVDDKKGRTIAGRVSVSDAHVTQFANRLHLLDPNQAALTPLLSGPKPTSFQHYLTQGSDEKKELYHYQDKNDTTLRGHKLYWHKDSGLQQQDYHDASARPDSTQHTVMRPVDKGVTFAFAIHFENLTAEELGAMLWVLRVAGDGKHCLKVGMAKPLGLGSVSVQARLCLSGRAKRYRTLFGDIDWAEDPVLFEFSKTAESSTTTQLATLATFLQDNETVEVQDTTPFVTMFEKYILTQIKANGGEDATTLDRLPRVQMLLTLLQWPGPDKEQTKYMQGPNDKQLPNQFKDRPVLPDPLWVTQPALQTIRNHRTNTRTIREMEPIVERTSSLSAAEVLAYLDREQSKSALSSPQQMTESLPSKNAPPLIQQVTTPLAQPTSLDDLKENDPLIGTVVCVEQESVLVNVGPGNLRLHIAQVQPPVGNQDALEENFPAGREINVWVRRNKQGKMQLTMKAPKT